MTNPAEIAEGPLLIGVILNAILLGVMSTQVYLYYTSFKNDRLWLKIFVAFIFLCDIINTACDVAGLYLTLIQHFGDFNYLGYISWLFESNPAIAGIVITSTQLFFTWRIYSLTKSWVFPVVIVITAMVGGVAALLTSVKIRHPPLFAELIKAKVPIIVWLSSEVLGDILITTILVRYLSKNRTGFQHTDLLIDRIIRMTIQTGLITAVVATTDLFVYLLDPTGLHLLFNFVLCKLYSNSLMSTLNSRGIWMRGSNEITSGNDPRATGTVSPDNVLSFRAPPPSPIKTAPTFGYSTGPHTEVYIDIESHELQDRNNDVV
ncbi:hypothetical protein BDZ97DRAFT_2077715 [Flammula alnicola]|nr:hypothetical protein BDZ97DRAFT_2077715 [Flammula alnicola]